LDALTTLHAIVRWPILLIGTLGLALSVWERGWEGRSPGWRPRLAPVYMGLLDLQFLLGIVLAVVDRKDLGRDAFHMGVMAAAVALAHVLRVRAKRLPAERQARGEALLFGLSLVVLLVGLSLIPE
jgi:hypothetical protein